MHFSGLHLNSRHANEESIDCGLLSSSGFRLPAGIDPSPELDRKDSSGTSWSVQNAEYLLDEMRRLKTQLNQKMEMYHVACKEAVAAKQKANELERRKMAEERRSQKENPSKEAGSATAKRGKTKQKITIKEDIVAQKLIEVEVQKRVNAEMQAL